MNTSITIKKSNTKNKKMKKLSSPDTNLFLEGGDTISYNPGVVNTGLEFTENTASSLGNTAINYGDDIYKGYQALKTTNTAKNAISAGSTGLSLGLNTGNYGTQLTSSLTSGLGIGSNLQSTATNIGLNTASPAAGAGSTASSAASALGTAANVAGALVGTGMLAYDTIKSSKLNDTSEFESAISDVGNTTFKFNNSNDVLNAAYSLPEINNVDWEDVRGQKMNVWSSMTNGLGAGASMGSLINTGVGTLIGAAAGALTGLGDALITNSVMKKKAKKRAEEINEELIPNALAQRQSNLNVATGNMQYNQIEDIMKNYAAYGGPLFNEFSNGVTIINEGGTHSENPYEGVQVGIDPEGIPNLVEEGEVIFKDYVFSNRLVVPDKVRTKYKLRKSDNLSFADGAKEITKMSEEMPNDPIVKRTMEVRLNELMQEQEMVRQKKNKNKENNQFSLGGQKKAYEKWKGESAKKGFRKDSEWLNSDAYVDFIDSRNNTWKDLGIGAMQAAPIFGSLAAVINDISGGNKPYYTNVDKYENAINKAYNPIEARTLSDYLEYNPYDISFGLNKLAASQAASRNALAQTTNNPAALRASILASDYNYGNQIGEELRRAQEYNDANRRAIADFNRGTNQFNAQAINATNQFNAQQAANKAAALGQVAQWRDQIYNANRAEKSANLTGLYEGIAGLGETFMNLKDRKYLMDNNIIVGPDGKLIQISKAKGGKINKIKNKRRLS